MLCFGSVRSLSFDCMQKRRVLIGCFRNQMCNKFRVEQDYHQWHWRVRQSYGPRSLLARPICRKWRDRFKRKKRQWEGAEFRQRCRNHGYPVIIPGTWLRLQSFLYFAFLFGFSWIYFLLLSLTVFVMDCTAWLFECNLNGRAGISFGITCTYQNHYLAFPLIERG